METKCDAATLETGRRLQANFDDRLALRDSIDPQFTQLWLDYAIKGLGRRKVVDERTRFLIQIGQLTMTRNASTPLSRHTKNDSPNPLNRSIVRSKNDSISSPRTTRFGGLRCKNDSTASR